VVSLGLHGYEDEQDASAFTEAFAIAREAGLSVAPHAGEFVGAGAVDEALTCASPQRIQHGIRAVESKSTVERLRDQQVCLDVCPTSNLVLGVTPDLTRHPLRDLMAAGVPCSLNADDPLIFRTTLLGEYEVARDVLGLSDQDLAETARTSVLFSSAPDTVKAQAHERIESWLTHG
jgi:adenosine deaminase